MDEKKEGTILVLAKDSIITTIVGFHTGDNTIQLVEARLDRKYSKHDANRHNG